MTKDRKEEVQIWSAIGMLIAGVALAAAGFIVEPVGKIDDSVIYIFAQCLVYAGSIFGVSIYIKGKFDHLQSKLLNKTKEGE